MGGEDKDAKVREAAALALGCLGRDGLDVMAKLETDEARMPRLDGVGQDGVQNVQERHSMSMCRQLPEKFHRWLMFHPQTRPMRLPYMPPH